MENFELVTVNYNTPDLVKRLIHPIIGKIDIRVIDGSDRPPFLVSQKDKEFKSITVDKFNFNIHHGRGMDFALRTSNKKYVLILDSDVEIIDNEFFTYLKNNLEERYVFYGSEVRVNEKGTNVPDSVYGFRYIHPSVMLVKRKDYFNFPPFKHHGAPCIDTMIYLNTKNLFDKFCKPLNEIDKFCNINGRGTVSRYGYNF